MGKAIIKGLTVEIGGNTTNLVKSIDEAERSAKRMSNTAENLKKKLLFSWDEKTFVRAQQTAQDAVNQTQARVEQLKQAMNSLDIHDEKARTQKQITELREQIEKAEASAEKARKKLLEINLVKLDHVIAKANQLGDSLIRAGSRMTMGVTTPLMLAGTAAVNVASDFAESQNVIDVAFGQSAASIDAWSKTLMDNFGLSQLSAKQYSGQFMTLSNAIGVAQDSGKEMATTLTEISSDMASFYNVRQDVAANALKAIYTGESESLKQFGVVMLDANLAAYAMSQGIKTAYADMDQAQKTMLRYQFVTQSLSLAQGDFARTSDSLANQQRILDEQCKELAIEFRNELLPISRDVVGWINETVKVFASLNEEQKKSVLVLAACAAAIGPIVTGVGAMSKMAAGATVLWKAFTTAQAAATVATAAGNSGVQAFTVSLFANTAAQAAATAGLTLLAAALVGLVWNISASNAELSEQEQMFKQMHEQTKTWDERLHNLANNGLTGANAELAKLDNLAQNVVPRIEELADKTEKTGEETDELRGLIPLLNEQLGYEAAAFEASTGSVRMNTSAIYSNIEAMRQRAVAQAAMNEYQELGTDLYEADKQLHEYEKQLSVIPEERRAVLNAKGDYVTYVAPDDVFMRKQLQIAIDDIVNQKKAIQGKMDELGKEYFPSLSEPQGDKTSTPSTSSAPLDNENRKKFEKDYRNAQYERDIGYISQEQYLKKVAALNNEHNSKDSESWQRYYTEYYNGMKKLQSDLTTSVKRGGGSRSSATKSSLAAQTAAVKAAYDKQVQIAKDAYAQKQAALKENHDAELKAIDDNLAAKESAINAEIAAIDRAIEARRREKQEGDYDTQINSLQASIDYGAGKFDDFTLRELQAQLSGVEEERAEYRWQLEQEDRKEALRQELDDARVLADQQKEALKAMHDQQMAALEAEYTLHLEQLDMIFMTADGQFKQISADFIATLDEGVSGIVAQLRAAIAAAQSETSRLESARQNTGYTDSRSYNPNVTFNTSGVTAGQVKRMVAEMMYE